MDPVETVEISASALLTVLNMIESSQKGEQQEKAALLIGCDSIAKEAIALNLTELAYDNEQVQEALQLVAEVHGAWKPMGWLINENQLNLLQELQGLVVVVKYSQMCSYLQLQDIPLTAYYNRTEIPAIVAVSPAERSVLNLYLNQPLIPARGVNAKDATMLYRSRMAYIDSLAHKVSELACNQAIDQHSFVAEKEIRAREIDAALMVDSNILNAFKTAYDNGKSADPEKDCFACRAIGFLVCSVAGVTLLRRSTAPSLPRLTVFGMRAGGTGILALGVYRLMIYDRDDETKTPV
ncbi:hypothetical protein CANCADRAFT_2796 [Tortispora caseinolytica NRRL Y-17796]|uniref:Uncharacterized protein n=1 Tax=Tortispora caseinolytica NRRL Y-17796 TaxID=767744 RepID=A0A1E4TH57_9ASCO|nr:hypothetical protein CANCADRAFT_2796 [Tortispora caseinolytica NRRL Y-17796]